MADLNFKTWDTTSSWSSNFKMTSKYTDLGSPDTKKSILGVVCNISIGTESSASSHSTFNFVIKYRTSVNSSFKNLMLFNNVWHSSKTNKNSIEIVKLLNRPIKDIINLQLQIKGFGIRNDFGINDFGLIFREYRSSNIVSLDEN
tara:strand:- start:773 stop:1207 length:435 start_codon:yes stop_codon:yes gene_type:complete